MRAHFNFEILACARGECKQMNMQDQLFNCMKFKGFFLNRHMLDVESTRAIRTFESGQKLWTRYLKMAVEIHSALSAYRLLNGVFCVYKPKFVSHRNLRMMLLKRLCQGKEKVTNSYMHDLE